MKKILGSLISIAFIATGLFAQVLPNSGVENTLWTGFGQQFPEDKVQNIHYYGLYETLQARVDVSQFTIEGMLNWAAETNWTKDNNLDYFHFANTQRTPFWYTNHSNQGGYNTNGLTDNYYVNFICNAISKNKNDLDFGMGTRLAWKIGPAPICGGYYWEPYTHIVQGGLKEGYPGEADVVGYTHYDNLYANHALGVRYRFDDFIEIGGSIPSGVTTDKPFFNAAFAIKPADFIRLSVAFENVFTSHADMYSGVSLSLKKVLIDAYLEIQNFGNDKDFYKTWGTGAAVTLYPVKNLMIRPEAGVTFYKNNDFTPAFYGAGKIEWKISDKYIFGGFSSLAWGSKNVYWSKDVSTKERKDHGVTESYNTTKNWNGGFIFDVRPDFTICLDKYNSITAAYDYQFRNSYNNESYGVWAAGVYWTYRK